jgi:hypothetical protein
MILSYWITRDSELKNAFFEVNEIGNKREFSFVDCHWELLAGNDFEKMQTRCCLNGFVHCTRFNAHNLDAMIVNKMIVPFSFQKSQKNWSRRNFMIKDYSRDAHIDQANSDEKNFKDIWDD